MKTILKNFEISFLKIHRDSSKIIMNTPEETLFLKPARSYQVFSVGEFILRSAGTVEKMIGGITTRLWDDPFEWTLPEELSKKEKILDYLEEVEKARKKGFGFFKGDEDLEKVIPAPEEIKTLFTVLLETCNKASHLQGQAKVVLEIIKSQK